MKKNSKNPSVFRIVWSKVHPEILEHLELIAKSKRNLDLTFFSSVRELKGEIPNDIPTMKYEVFRKLFNKE